MELRNANILITGGGRGIGYFLSTQLVEKVSNVVVIEKDKQLLDTLPKHSNLYTYVCDITDPEQIERVMKEIFELVNINVCINNAGVIHSEPLVNLLSRGEKKHNFDAWRKVIDVNLNAVFYITAHIAEAMVLRKQRGVIINISSISANGNIGQSAYSASKAGVEALTKTWSKELGMFKIRCACIAPGFFETPSTKESLSENMLTKWRKSVAVGRLGELEELLSGVVFIITNEYYNGKVLSIDGGLTL